MDKNLLFALTEGLNLEYQIGIISEIRSFCEHKQEQQMIHDCQLRFGSNTYLINMKLTQFSFSAAKQLFTEFVRYIEYPGSTFYVIETSGRSVMYYLLSCTKDREGIFSQIKIH